MSETTLFNSDQYTVEEQEQIRNIVRTLHSLGKNDLLLLLNSNLCELVKKVRQSGRKGSVSVKITVGPFDRGNTDVLKVEHLVKPSFPVIDSPATVLHPHKDGTMHTEIEGQMTLNLNHVSDHQENTPPRTV